MTDLPSTTAGPAGKFALLVVLFLVALIPSWLMSGVITDREERQAEMAHEFTASWGPEQTLATPVLVVPYETTPGGTRQYLKIGAEKLQIGAHLAPEDRRRGLFHASVYGAAVQMKGVLSIPSSTRLTASLGDKSARLLWQESFVSLAMTSRAGTREGDKLTWNGKDSAFQNCHDVVSSGDECRSNGLLLARVPEASGLQPDGEFPFEITIDLRGTTSFTLASTARQLDALIAGSWPTPSFGGSLLPVSSEVTKQGFEARWQSIDFAASRSWTSGYIADTTAPAAAIRVDLLEAVPTYRMIHRAAKYHALFLALCFATYMLFEILSGIRIHLVQYGLMALSLSLFALLLLSLAEPLGYDAGFLGSSLLVLVQASFYTATIAKRLRESGLFAAMLTSLFGFLYVLLSLESYSLLVGSLALFLVLSVLMAVTSKIDWTRWGMTSLRDAK